MPNGYLFALDPMSMRFFPAGEGGSAGDGTCYVTGATDMNVAQTALNAGVAVPVAASSKKWTVSFAALATAIQGGTRTVATPW